MKSRKIIFIFSLILFGSLFFGALKAQAAGGGGPVPRTLYWFNGGGDADWNTLTGNWWNDETHTVQAASLPTSIDTTITVGTAGTGPNVTLGSWISPASINATATGITFTNALRLPLEQHVTGDATFNSNSYNDRTITGNATFNDTSYNNATVTGNATFTYASGGTITLNDDIPGWNTVGGTARDVSGNPITNFIFNGASYNLGTVSGNAIFNNTSDNGGTVTGNACFAATATNSGTVNGTTAVCNAPAVSTSAASSLAQTTTTLNGNLTDTYAQNVTSRGFNYGLTTDYGTTVTQSSGPYAAGTFTANLTGLTCGTSYHFRTFAINYTGTGYGSDTVFTTADCSASNSSGNVARNRTNIISPALSCRPEDKFSVVTGLPCASFITSSPSVPVPACSVIATLKFGSSGEEVKCLQSILQAAPALVQDGIFGLKTKAAVIAFQTLNKLVPDGIVGPLTRAVLGM